MVWFLVSSWIKKVYKVKTVAHVTRPCYKTLYLWELGKQYRYYIYIYIYIYIYKYIYIYIYIYIWVLFGPVKPELG